jgi:hypothetical protein
MAGSRYDPGEWERPPPRRGNGVPARTPTPTTSVVVNMDSSTVAAGSRPVSTAQQSDAAPALEPRRLGHDAESCTTCQVVVAMQKRRSEQELIALRSRLRIVDLRDGER